MLNRLDGRRADELRPVRITPNYARNAGGSALIDWGATRVLCAVSIIDELPAWMRKRDAEPTGWLTAEYQLLPQSTQTRTKRERTGPGGRSHEIQRLIGRTLRAACDLTAFGPRSVYVDCDVIDADGGTRCASITGAMVALRLAVARWLREGLLTQDPILRNVAAVSSGIVGGEPLLDLCYAEDSEADVDMNVIMTSDGDIVEVQGTAEGAPFSRRSLDAMLDLALAAAPNLFAAQNAAL